MDPVDCYCWNSSGSFFYGSILSIEWVGEHVLTLSHPKHPQISLDLTLCPQKNHGHLETETVFGVCHGHGSSGLLLLKLLRIILLWIHAFHWMCRWTCLDLSVVPQFRMCLVLIGMRWRIADTIINLSRSQVVLKFCCYVVIHYLPIHYNHTVLLP